MNIETTIKDVLGAAPWAGLDGLNLTSETRPAARTFISRMGVKADVMLTLTLDELRTLYTDPEAFKAKFGYGDAAQAEQIATAPYAPKNKDLLAYLQKKKGGKTVTTSKAETTTTETVETVAPKKTAAARLADAMAGDDTAAARLADAVRLIAGSVAGPIDEARVIELIKQHTPKPSDNVVRHEVTIKNGADAVTIKGAQHPKLAILAKAMTSRMTNGFAPNVFLVGPTASGKTHAVEQVAGAMGRAFQMHGAMSMPHELMGFKDAGGTYHTTPFREAFEKGGVALLDELDSWDPAVTLALNAALSNGHCAFPDGMIRRHADCIIVGAGNTHGTGPTAEFVGRNRLDAAFLSRFPVRIDWPRDAAIEKAISANDAWVARVTKARERAAAAGIKHMIDPRHSQAGAALIAAGMSSDEVAEITYLAGLQDAQRRTVEGR